MKNSGKLLIASAILLIVNIIAYTTRLGGDTVLRYFSDGLPVVCALISSLCLLGAYREFEQFDFAKRVWLLLLAGMIMFFIAESLYAILEIAFKADMNEQFPSIADIFWCAGYIPLFTGLILMIAGYKKSGFPMGNRRQYVLLSVVSFSLAAAVTALILVPVIKDTETTTLDKAFYIFYPAADILLVIPSIIIIYITSLFGKGVISRPWKYVALGFVSFTVADLLYSYLGWQDLYGNGNLIDLAWHLGYLLLALAGLCQKELIQSLNKSHA
jgi:hypothetical protein